MVKPIAAAAATAALFAEAPAIGATRVTLHHTGWGDGGE